MRLVFNISRSVNAVLGKTIKRWQGCSYLVMSSPTRLLSTHPTPMIIAYAAGGGMFFLFTMICDFTSQNQYHDSLKHAHQNQSFTNNLESLQNYIDLCKGYDGRFLLVTAGACTRHSKHVWYIWGRWSICFHSCQLRFCSRSCICVCC